jgi:hypothetical protein
MHCFIEFRIDGYSSVDIAKVYALDDPHLIPSMAKFSLLHNIQTDSPIVTGGNFPRDKAAGREALLFLVSWCGLRLSPLGTSASNLPIVPAPDDS